MDPPSQQLIERLRALRLCRPSDLRRCRPLVRRLSRDLPTFDSVWIDALIQTRRLTPFQAKILDSSDPDRLDVGPFVLLDHLGDDGRVTRYLARKKEGTARFLLSRIRCQSEQAPAALDRVREFIQATGGIQERSLSLLTGCALQDNVLTVVSPHVPGRTLAELLVRRGRFPATVVHDIAAQLAGSLGALESVQLVHGDLRLRNVVLHRSGRAVLLLPGLLANVDPELTIHVNLPPDVYDTVAPERVGTGDPASTATDLYALGCMLFELIAGRPPFPHGDPLAKLAAHQSQAIPDVRRFAPETPDATAALLARLTARDSLQRPSSFAELAQQLKCRGAPRRLRQFEARFQHPVRMRRTPPRPSLARRVVVPLLLLSAAANLALLHAGARMELLSIADTFTKSIGRSVQDPDEQTAHSLPSSLQPFPTDVRNGVLTLEGGRRYAAGRLAAVGSLVIQGDSDQRPVIVVTEQPIELWADSILLENVVIQARENEKAPSELLAVNCQQVGLRNCAFECPGGDAGIAALNWTALDEASAAPRRIALVDCLFCGVDSSLRLKSLPSTMMFRNVLQLASGTLVELRGRGGATRTASMSAEHVTLRESASLVRIADNTRPGPSPPFLLTLESCVLDLVPDRSALILFSFEPPHDWHTRMRITGEGSLIRPGTPIAAMTPDAGATTVPLNADRLSVDGLFAAEYTFVGEDVMKPATAGIASSDLSGRSLIPPGADAAAFSPIPSDAYNSESMR